jgi:imidazole glycerol-phosphate synthase subunit HisF
MLQTRVIPVLLLQNKGLVKTKQFKKPTYIGDPINAVKIFNEKEVDELIFLDINASKENRKPNLEYLKEIATECFMPLGYGGAIQTIDDIKNLLSTGIEKAIINTAAVQNPDFIKEGAVHFGNSTLVVSIDYKKDLFGKLRVYTKSGTEKQKLHPVDFALQMAEYGAGEIMLNAIDKDGMMNGYDIALIKDAMQKLKVPLIACGGAGGINDIETLVKQTGIKAAAAGSMFVFQSATKGVLITYPTQQVLKEKLY